MADTSPTSVADAKAAWGRARMLRNNRRWCDEHDALQPCVHCEVNAAETLVAILESELAEARAEVERLRERLRGVAEKMRELADDWRRFGYEEARDMADNRLDAIADELSPSAEPKEGGT